MFFGSILAVILAAVFGQASTSSDWPYAPFRTQGRDIVNARNESVKWAGVNWPLNAETMIPEGLEWTSADEILDSLKDVGFNFIRMGYAVEMVDQIYLRNGSDVPLNVALIEALGVVNGTSVARDMIAKNQGWNETTTRFQIWGDIISKAAQRQIYVHPDVHVGVAKWCCSYTDGEAWFDDVDFPAKNWTRALAYISNFAKSYPNIVSMSLRNEPRESYNRTLDYGWNTLVGNFTQGSDVIFQNNPDLLITWSGLNYDSDLSALTAGTNLWTAPCYKCDYAKDKYRLPPKRFNLSEHPWADKLVWELHAYDTAHDLDTDDCEIFQAEMYKNGLNALGIPKPSACNITQDCPDAVNKAPIVFTEFGALESYTMYNSTLQTCLRKLLTDNEMSWAMWGLAGSYRIRSGVQGYEDTWGLTNYNWSDWRDPGLVQNWWKPFVQETLGETSWNGTNVTYPGTAVWG